MLLFFFWAHASAQEAFEVTDSFGKHYFYEPPSNVVVTDWSVLDNLLSLGVVPSGAPQLEEYRLRVAKPSVPNSVTDIGLRQAPSITALRELAPDVIILGTGQKDLARPFSRVSKVLYFKHFSDRYRDIEDKSRTRFLQLSALFQNEAEAEKLLKDMDASLADFKRQLEQKNTTLPSIAIAAPVSPANSHSKATGQWVVFGENSLPGAAAKHLGLKNITDWGYHGEKQFTDKQLKALNYDLLLVIQAQLPLPTEVTVATQPNTVIMDQAWPYGGALSIGRLAETMFNAVSKHVAEAQ